METNNSNGKVVLIKNIYFYLVSFVALMMTVFSLADIINITLKTYIFTKADNINYYPTTPCVVTPNTSTTKDNSDCIKEQAENQKINDDNKIAQREQDVVRDISFIVVGIPLFIFHWKVIRRKE